MKIFQIIVIAFFCKSLLAQNKKDENVVNANLQEVTIYRQYAKELRTAKALIPQGESELILRGVASNVIPQSIQIGIKGNVTLLSSQYRNNFLANPNRPSRLKTVEDSLKLLQDKVDDININISVLNDEENIYKNNNKLGSQHESLKPEQVILIANNYSKRVLEIRKELKVLAKQKFPMEEQIAKLQNQLNNWQSENGKNVQEIVLQLYAKTAIEAEFKASYIITGAGWTPIYDLRVAEMNKPISLTYKANVYQTSGNDWKNINLNVSTGNPALSQERPILTPKYVDFGSVYGYGKRKLQYNALGQSNLYQQKENAKSEILSENDSQFRNGAQASNYEVEVDENILNVEFKIDAKYNIPSDGLAHVVILNENTLNGTFNHHSVPSLDQSAFLIAKITDWGSLNLIPGQANLFLEENYIGQTSLNPSVANDTMILSLGRDNGINVKRIKLNDKESKKNLGTQTKETFTYEMSFKNNKNASVEIEVLDNIPISKNEKIIVELEDKSNAEFSPELGKLLWKVKLGAGQSKKIKWKYSIKYPSGTYITDVY
jgi:uncharacterized protein (TIGR02231 family)